MELFVLLWAILFGRKEKTPEPSALESAKRSGSTNSEANRILSGIYQRIRLACDRGEYSIEASLGVHLDSDTCRLIKIKLEHNGYTVFHGAHSNWYLNGWITISWDHLSK
jgi:hypothetical protein